MTVTRAPATKPRYTLPHAPLDSWCACVSERGPGAGEEVRKPERVCAGGSGQHRVAAAGSSPSLPPNVDVRLPPSWFQESTSRLRPEHEDAHGC